MSLIWHIARKDLRRLRLPLVGWAVLIAIKLVFGVLLIFGVGADPSLSRFTSFAYASRGMVAIEILFGYVLVASVVQADLMVGTTAFWMTRPISGVRMFGGKVAALAVIFGVIPIAITLPWWLACGYGWREVTFATVETLLWQGVVVLIALSLATLTDGLARFLLWTVVVLGVLVGLAAQTPGEPASVVVSSLVIASMVFVVGCGAAAAIHFCIRRFSLSVGILGASALAAYFVAVGPWQFTPPAGWLAEDQPGRYASGIQLSYRDTHAYGRNGPNSDLLVGLRADGVPPELVLGGSGENRWAWESGLSLRRRGELVNFDQDASWLALGLMPFQLTPNAIAYRDALRAFQGLPPWSEYDAKRINVAVSVRAEFVGRVLKDQPSYLLRADLRLVRPIVLGEKPARGGETIASGAEITRVVAIRISYLSRGAYLETNLPVPNERLIGVTLTEHGPGFFGRMWLSETDAKFSSAWPRREYFLVNRQRGNAVMDDGGGEWKTKPVRIGTVAIVWRTLQFSPARDFRASDKTWEEQPGWLENLSLAKLKFRTEERFTQELHVDRFTIDPDVLPRGAR